MTEITALQKLEKKKKNKKYLWLAFFAPCILMYIIYFARGTYPFGNESVLVLDLNAQYVYFFGALRRVLHGDGSLIYSFSRALGGEFVGIFAYYLSSPLSWIVAIFPENMMLEALLFLFTLKCGLCGLTLAIYLDSHNIGTKPSRIIFGILYALCGYGVIYQHNTMWIDCMYLLPIVALGIEQLISKRKYLLFTVSLAVAIFSSFYIGYMMCIFCLIYFFYAYFCVTENLCREKAHFIKSLLRMGLFSAIALGLSACITIPTYYSLGFGKNTFTNPEYFFDARYNFIDLVSRLFINAYDTVRPEGLPIIYCGMLTMIMLPLFFMAKQVKLKDKVGTGMLIGIFVVSMSVDAIDKVWHGMQAPNWLNYRYSFMLVFIMIVAAAKAFKEIRRFTTGQVAGVIGAWFIILMMSQANVEFYTEKIHLDRNLLCFYVSAAFLAIYAAALSIFKNKSYKKAATSVMLVIISAEMLLSGIVSICFLDDDVVYSTRSSYLDNKAKFEDSADFILEHDDSFYRFDKTKHPLINTPMMLGIRGFTNSTSTLNNDTINFLRYMGLSSKSHWSKYYGGTPPFDSFLAVKYIMATEDYDVPNGYMPIYTGNATTVYQNPNALSVAYAVNSNIKDIHLAYPRTYDEDIAAGKYEKFTAYHTPPERMNVMMGAMLGYDEAVSMFVPVKDVETRDANLNYSYIAEHSKYVPINADSAAAVYYDFTAEVDGIIYMYIPSDYPREASVLVNGVDKGTVLANETDRIISLGKFNAGEEITVTLTLKDDKIYIREDEPYFWYIDDTVLNDCFASLAKNQFVIDKWSDTSFEGTLTATENRTSVFTSIPYDANWRVFVDGKEVPTYKNLDALVGFDITPGEHSVVIKYVHKQLYTGIAISVCSALLLAAILLFGKLMAKSKAKKAALVLADYEEVTDVQSNNAAEGDDTVDTSAASKESENDETDTEENN